MNKKYILSPCGTSLLTNFIKGNPQQSLIYKHANAKNKSDVPEDDRKVLAKIIEQLALSMETAGYEKAQDMSAELNSIIKFYGGVLPESNDFHLLICSDTWLGEVTAEFVSKWILQTCSDMTVVIYRQEGLQTREMTSFQWALSDLIKKFYDELPGYKAAGYEIVFNLTGGFKAVQGFLQSIANFFADETIYIFERSEMLMRIPRLPVRLDAVEIVENNLVCFRNLAMGVPYVDKIEIPETMILRLYDEVELSAWGEVLWNEAREQLYKAKLWPSPSPKKIQYGSGFKKSTAAIAPDRMRHVNNTIDQLNRFVHDRQSNLNSLDFKALKGRSMAPSTHEIDAWSDSDARRVFLHKNENSCYVLDKLAQGLH
jgi:putative CRISPR-associated protein (TIGR02619 family)